MSKDLAEKVVVIAASTGGPKSLQSVVPVFPADLDAAVVIIQHMPASFTNSLAVRLDSLSKIKVKEGEDGEYLKKGIVYIAKGGRHLFLKEVRKGVQKIVYSDEAPREGVRPCANYTYESLIHSHMKQIICVVMTGMGSDGTVGIGALKEKQPIYVMAQDEDSSVIYGMPKVVTEKKLVDKVVSLNQIAKNITDQVGVLNHGY